MKTLYLDMDGVVADFNAYAIKTLTRKIDGDERWAPGEWRRLADNPRLYRDLERTPEADQLVEFCRRFCEQRGYALLFLTAIPKKNDVPWAFYDKVLWAQLRYPDIPVMFGPYSQDKQHHCEPGDILIDDRTINIQEWQAAGGVGILHRGDLTNTLQLLVNEIKPLT
jgi:hypothetical protein